jgi:hypothetical protein
MTTLMEELRLAVREILQSIGLGGSANAAAAVLPVLMLGIALNVIALSVVDRLHPIRAVRAEARLVQSVTVCVLRQIEGRERGLCSAKRWASSRLAEMVKCRISTGFGRVASRSRTRVASPCGDRSYPMGARETLQAI